MSKTKTIDRRRFLTGAGAAMAAVTLTNCKSEDDNGGAGASAAGTAAAGTGAAGTTAGMGQAGTSATGGTMATSGGTMAQPSGGTMATSGGTGASGTGASGTGASGTGASGTGASGTGAGAGGAGGAGGDGGSGGSGGGYMCEVDVMGPHSHPVTIPGEDVELGFGGPYTLEEGGTSHTHMLDLSPYDFAYLQAGAMQTVSSSEESDHSHQCVITCTPS